MLGPSVLVGPNPENDPTAAKIRLTAAKARAATPLVITTIPPRPVALSRSLSSAFELLAALRSDRGRAAR